MIQALLDEKVNQISIYRDKWHPHGFSSEPIDTVRASQAIESVYAILGLPKPEIYYFPSPAKALEQFNLDLWGSETVDIDARLVKNIKKQINNKLLWQLQSKLYESLHGELWNLTGAHIYSTLNAQSNLIHKSNKDKSNYFNPARDCVPTEYLIAQACMFDFCYSVLNCVGEEKLWQAYQALIQNCGWLWTYEKVCLVCERPYIIS